MEYRGVVLDVDGTVVRGDEAIPGALDGLAAIDAAGLDRLFVSNNPTKAPKRYEARLGRAGIDASADEIVTSGTTTTAYLADRHPGARTFCIGESGLCDQLSAAGLELVGAHDDPEVVVVAIDREFDYDDLRDAGVALRDGAAFYGTDPDILIPAADGDIPGSGAIINAVAGVAERDPDAILGKPSSVAREYVLDRLGLPPEDVLIVGDRLDTDIAFGLAAGMETAVVRTGVTDDAALARSEYEPDHVLDGLGDVYRLIS
ncbi:putative HAD superfamily sugar phosphatase [Haloferax mucosum ATCC BAA-1512]|uniref:Putative HAD superfamily sugar phosphatase n=1 Tax=Haloferax mucosum ATCC BAA-1512 TaxID=662479 RepID=M0I5N7_9EURY|nr:HAD-IIA family hydrolase [Haloferax mucosum]ELZ91282.1 putative HAD superfamily sugar phosphatase [Haloferax mucosum ATCC BAA-1512]